MERLGKLHERVFQDQLHAGSAIGESLTLRCVQINRLIKISRRTKEFDETRRIGPCGGGVKLEVIQVEGERAVGSAAYQLTHLLDQGGLAVGSEAHDFVFVLVHFEAEIRSECRIQHPQRMRKPDFTKAPDFCATVRISLAVAN